MKEKSGKQLNGLDFSAMCYFFGGGFLIMGITSFIIDNPMTGVSYLLFMVVILMTAFKHKQYARLTRLVDVQKEFIELLMEMVTETLKKKEEDTPQPPMPEMLNHNGIPIGRADEKADGAGSIK